MWAVYMGASARLQCVPLVAVKTLPISLCLLKLGFFLFKLFSMCEMTVELFPDVPSSQYEAEILN